MSQLENDCKRVPGWTIPGRSFSDEVQHILQTLIDDGLVEVKSRFTITGRGLEYVEDPLKWQIEVETPTESESRLFWNTIYAVFDRAYARLRARAQTGRA